MIETAWLIFSYLLGSIPFGYIITRLSSGKNILEIGWKKTSGSNVFANIGKWQGILTATLDLSKGYLAVWAAQKFGLSLNIQVFSGVLAVVGHNWSCFLAFSGGRGIGTLVGAFWALSPKVLGLALLPALLMTVVWNAAIGTVLLLITALALSLYFNQFETVGIFIIVLLFPIFLKRLSPIKEIFPLRKKAALIRNRLFFDNDQLCLDLRVKRILKRLLRR